MDEGQNGGVLWVPDDELEFGPDLVMHYRGQPFTGVSYGVMEDGKERTVMPQAVTSVAPR